MNGLSASHLMHGRLPEETQDTWAVVGPDLRCLSHRLSQQVQTVGLFQEQTESCA